MTTCKPAHVRLVLPLLIACGTVPGCRRDEARAPQADPAAAVTTTTTSTTTTTTLPPPPPVWREARWRMTPEEVLAAFPKEAQRPEQPASFQGTPGTAEIVLPAYDADGAKFRVLFGFAGGGLSRIQLASPRAQAETCYDVEQRLTGEHGEPSSRREEAASVQTRAVAWSLPAQTITLTCVDKPSLGFRTVTLDYAAPGGPSVAASAPAAAPAN